MNEFAELDDWIVEICTSFGVAVKTEEGFDRSVSKILSDLTKAKWRMSLNHTREELEMNVVISCIEDLVNIK